MNSIFFCIIVLTLFGCLESMRLDKRKHESQLWPSASARARLRANAQRAGTNLDLEHKKCPSPTTACLITPYNVTATPQPQALNSTLKQSSALNATLQPRAWNSSASISASNSTLPWECVDLEQELTACGACNHDCTSIPNVDSVGCERGSCKIFTCQPGYSWSEVFDESTREIVALCL